MPLPQPKAGDKIKVITTDETLEGLYVPNEETSTIVVKLFSGYNVGVDKKKIKDIVILGSFSPKPENNQEKKRIGEKLAEKDNKKLPIISILHTGGTIASKVDYRTGGVVSRFTPEEIIASFPELHNIATIKSRLISSMFSEDMRFAHYTMMINAIQEEINQGADGIIVTHGTDTMHYTSAALAFALENLSVPVIMVGAQRSSDRGSNDAGMNLICAATFITKTDFAGVGICMHESMNDDWCVILPATKTRKMHTSRRDAFRAINTKPIAHVHYQTKEIQFLQQPYTKRSNNKLVVREKFEEKVGLLKCHPNMFPEQFAFFKGYRGLIIEGTGLGQAPVDVINELTKIHEKNLRAIEELCNSGCIVVMTSQCISGRVQMHVYTAAIDLVKVGVIAGEDMLPETAFIKLAWLLGNYKPDEAKRMMQQNLRGEINPQLGREFDID